MACLLLIVLVGCATPPPSDDPEAMAEFKEANDPIEPANRVAFDVNDTLDGVVLVPLARGYRAITTEPIRNSVRNFLANLGSPVVLVNDALEGKPRRAGDTLTRFLVNSTVGVLGIFDVASRWGYPPHDAGFGTTLAVWGVDEGPFLYLLVLGPSNPRDLGGFGADLVTDPVQWVSGGVGLTIASWTRFGLNAVGTRERLLDPVEQIKKTALDPYATFRSLYRQHRKSQIDETRGDVRATVPVWFDSPSGPPH
jgi:phospholipid-binding lipoprotein MlaA